MSDLDGSASALYALCSAAFSTAQSLTYLAIPHIILSILEPVAKDQLPSTAGPWLLRFLGVLLLALAYPQFQLGSGALEPSEPEHFYTWAFTLFAQIVTFLVAYMRYTAARTLAPPLTFEGGLAWSVLMGGAGGLAVWGVWCLLFVEGRPGASHGKVRSSSWLFPTREKRKAKVEKREKRYGSGAAVK